MLKEALDKYGDFAKVRGRGRLIYTLQCYKPFLLQGSPFPW